MLDALFLLLLRLIGYKLSKKIDLDDGWGVIAIHPILQDFRFVGGFRSK